MKCDKNPKKIQSMFDEISSGYDLMNNFISLGTHFVIKFITVLDLKIKLLMKKKLLVLVNGRYEVI